MFDGFRSRCTTCAECIYASPRNSWYIKYCWCSALNAYYEFMILYMSVCINSKTIYKSSNYSMFGGAMISSIEAIFSCLRWRRIVISCRILVASPRWANTLSSFLMATCYWFRVSSASTTIPYAPYPNTLIGL